MSRQRLANLFGLAAIGVFAIEPAVTYAQPYPMASLPPAAYARGGQAPIVSTALMGAAQSAQTVRVDLGGSNSGSRTLTLPRGKSAVVDLPVDARDVVVSDPKVADVVLSTPRRIYVMGIGSGQTDATFMDANGRQILSLAIRVDQDVSALSQTLNRLLPGSAIRIEALNDNIVLSGQVANASDADKALRLTQGMVAKPEQVVNMLGITAPEQVMLKVRIVEVNRSVIKQLGVNLQALLNQSGEPQYSLGRAATYGLTGALLGGFTGGYSVDTTMQPELKIPCSAGGAGDCYGIFRDNSVASNGNTATLRETAGSAGLNKAKATIDAFERVGLVRTLAEPNLTTTSGEAARFLAGGEFPVPTGQDVTGRVSVTFKPYGVALGFTPVVLGPGRISLKLSTEVSELTNVGSFTLNSGTGSGGPNLTVPGLNVRRAETVVELPSGGAMMIAGLLQSTTKQTLDSLPGLMQLPVLGALFRSRDFQNNESELVVIVTPYLARPGHPEDFQTPADGLQIATDQQTILLGRLNRAYGREPADKTKTYQGPFGYVVE
ncbi:MAG: type II and III secretion system protein family protein [Caulobacteraceae bacterium]